MTSFLRNLSFIRRISFGLGLIGAVALASAAEARTVTRHATSTCQSGGGALTCTGHVRVTGPRGTVVTRDRVVVVTPAPRAGWRTRSVVVTTAAAR